MGSPYLSAHLQRQLPSCLTVSWVAPQQTGPGDRQRLRSPERLSHPRPPHTPWCAGLPSSPRAGRQSHLSQIAAWLCVCVCACVKKLGWGALDKRGQVARATIWTRAMMEPGTTQVPSQRHPLSNHSSASLQGEKWVLLPFSQSGSAHRSPKRAP